MCQAWSSIAFVCVQRMQKYIEMSLEKFIIVSVFTIKFERITRFCALIEMLDVEMTKLFHLKMKDHQWSLWSYHHRFVPLCSFIIKALLRTAACHIMNIDHMIIQIGSLHIPWNAPSFDVIEIVVKLKSVALTRMEHFSCVVMKLEYVDIAICYGEVKNVALIFSMIKEHVYIISRH
jgi:hypothetical protein